MKLEDGSYDNEEKFHEYQTKWYETKDETWLWEMYPIVLHAVKSMMIKQLHGRWIPNFNDLADNGTLYFLERAKRRGPIEGKIITYAYWLARYALSERFTRPNQLEFDIEEATVNTSLDEIQSNTTVESFEDELVDKLTYSKSNNKFIKYEEYNMDINEKVMIEDLDKRIAFCQEMDEKLFAIKLEDEEQNNVVKYYKEGNLQNLDFFKAMRNSLGASASGIDLSLC